MCHVTGVRNRYPSVNISQGMALIVSSRRQYRLYVMVSHGVGGDDSLINFSIFTNKHDIKK